MNPTTPPADPVDGQDPETTSAADADWLAELRANSRSTGRPLSDLVGETTINDGTPDGTDDTEWSEAGDDEETIAASGDAFDQVRAAVRAARSQPAVEAVVPAPALNPSAAPPTEPTAARRQAPETDFGAPVAPTPASPPAQPRSMAFPEDLGAPLNRPPAASSPAAGPRWEAPPRLEGAKENTGPVFSSQLQSNRSIDWRVAVGAIAAALAIGAIAAILLSGGDEPPTEPVDTGTVDSVVAEVGIDGEIDGEEGDS